LTELVDAPSVPVAGVAGVAVVIAVAVDDVRFGDAEDPANAPAN